MHNSLPTAGTAPSGSPAAFGSYGRALLRVSQIAAILGGLALVGLVIMSLISVVGRKLFSMPVPGDMEVLQMVAAAACASFFAYCHLSGGDVKVDFFTQRASLRTRLLLDATGSLLVGLFATLLTWRSAVGVLFMYEVQETSAILEWPMWLAQAAMLPGFLLLALSGFYLASAYLRARCEVKV
ncbi:hypothetical protein AwPolaro_09090 [Polaromonas sp.]|nr:hypothetical protein AwPolaro_09090 [Polaromonas sp.]